MYLSTPSNLVNLISKLKKVMAIYIISIFHQNLKKHNSAWTFFSNSRWKLLQNFCWIIHLHTTKQEDFSSVTFKHFIKFNIKGIKCSSTQKSTSLKLGDGGVLKLMLLVSQMRNSISKIIFFFPSPSTPHTTHWILVSPDPHIQVIHKEKGCI